jgi:hypothetical protein
MGKYCCWGDVETCCAERSVSRGKILSLSVNWDDVSEFLLVQTSESSTAENKPMTHVLRMRDWNGNLKRLQE